MLGKVPDKHEEIPEKISREESKKRAGELSEKLDILGGESEKVAAKGFQELGKIEDKKEQEIKDTNLTILDGILSTNKRHNAYYESLSKMAQDELKKVDWPKGYGFHSYWTDRGVGILFESPAGRKFSQGFVPSSDPIIDMAACEILALRAENTVDKLEGREFINPGEIILPR